MLLDLRPGRLPQPGIHQIREPGQNGSAHSASLRAGPPGTIPAAKAGDTYFSTVLRSTPRLVAISLCDLPACQWTKISVTSTTLNVLLANPAPARSIRRRQPSFREDHTNGDTLTVPVGKLGALAQFP